MQQNYSWLKQNTADRNYIDQCKWHAIKSNAEEKDRSYIILKLTQRRL